MDLFSCGCCCKLHVCPGEEKFLSLISYLFSHRELFEKTVAKYPHFNALDDGQKFIYLMSQEDSDITQSLAKSVHRGFEFRTFMEEYFYKQKPDVPTSWAIIHIRFTPSKLLSWFKNKSFLSVHSVYKTFLKKVLCYLFSFYYMYIYLIWLRPLVYTL